MENQIMPVKDFFRQESVEKKFKEMLGAKAPSFLVSLINVISNNDKLQGADRNSMLFAAATAAALDLPVDPNLGFAYIIPYNDRKRGLTLAQFQIGWKGIVQLAQRSGQYRSINVVEVYEGDDDASVMKRLTSIITPTPPSRTVVGYASWFLLHNGFEKTLYMNYEEMKDHAMTYSQAYKAKYGQWFDDFDAMGRKTVIKLLISKWGPQSIEMQKAIQSDQATSETPNGPDYPDNKKTAVDSAPEQRQASLAKFAAQKTGGK